MNKPQKEGEIWEQPFLHDHPPSENPGSDDSQGALYMRPHMGPCSGLATLQTWRAGCWATPRPASEHLSTSA